MPSSDDIIRSLFVNDQEWVRDKLVRERLEQLILDDRRSREERAAALAAFGALGMLLLSLTSSGVLKKKGGGAPSGHGAPKRPTFYRCLQPLPDEPEAPSMAALGNRSRPSALADESATV